MSSFPTPSIIIYCPWCKLSAAVKVYETSFEPPDERDTKSSLKIPVELPRAPFGVKVPAAIISPPKSLDAVTVTLISVLSPLETATSAGVNTETGTCFDASSLAILFSVHSLNHNSLSGSTANCMTFAMPHAVASEGQSVQALFCEGTQYSINASSSG